MGQSPSQPVRIGADDRHIRIELPSRSYDVLIGAAVRYELAEAIRAAAPGAARAALFVDEGIRQGSLIAALHMSLTRAGLTVLHDESMVLSPSESMKSLATVERLTAALSAYKLDRSDVAVVLGGGVLGDLVGFAASAYRRGIRWINLPSTLLAMVDASVGGKTGANLLVNGSLKKNMVGAFWQPAFVVADVDSLHTLDDRHFRAGLAECIKHGMLSAGWGDPDLGAWTAASLPAILKRDTGTLIELIARNVTVKAAVVGHDEREEAPDAERGRALLNLGHTFGHVIETLPHLSPDDNPANAPLHHGEAVALGLIAASAAAELLGIAPSGTLDRTFATLSAAGLPTAIAGLPPTPDLIALMQHDKKVARGQLRLVLPTQPGHCRVVSDPSPGAVEAGWQAIRA
jgi:3-dehydroquinate synthase